MVRKQFENVDIECWERVASPRFGVKPPFICLKGGSEACDVILGLLDELGELRPPAQRPMTVKTGPRSGACRQIRFLISPADQTLTEMSFIRESDVAVFEFTFAGLRRFQEAVQQWKNGLEDFLIRPSRTCTGTKDGKSGEVWFWTPSTDP